MLHDSDSVVIFWLCPFILRTETLVTWTTYALNTAVPWGILFFFFWTLVYDIQQPQWPMKRHFYEEKILPANGIPSEKSTVHLCFALYALLLGVGKQVSRSWTGDCEPRLLVPRDL